MTKMITNVSEAFGVTDGIQKYYQNAVPFKNTGAAAIVARDLVAFEWAETGEVLGVQQADTDVVAAVSPLSAVGVSLEAIPVDSIGLIVVAGYAEVNIGSGTVAAGEMVIPTANAGEADGLALSGTPADTAWAGFFLGDEIGTTNSAPCWVQPGGGNMAV